MDEINIDMAKRTPNEWANIYSLKLFNFNKHILWTEYEWAYSIFNIDYMYIAKKENDELSTEYAEMMELRAMEIKNLIFKTADTAEREILKKKYIETEYIKRKILAVNNY
jgi:hypothetical protein